MKLYDGGIIIGAVLLLIYGAFSYDRVKASGQEVSKDTMIERVKQDKENVSAFVHEHGEARYEFNE